MESKSQDENHEQELELNFVSDSFVVIVEEDIMFLSGSQAPTQFSFSGKYILIYSIESHEKTVLPMESLWVCKNRRFPVTSRHLAAFIKLTNGVSVWRLSSYCRL